MPVTLGNQNITSSTGNLGIGTDSPARNLHVFGTDNSNSVETRIEQNGTSDVVLRIKRLGSDLAYFGNARASLLGGSATDTGLTAVNNLVLATASTERMRITSAGNVGIGTSSPETRLHVRGTQTQQGINDAAHRNVEFFTSISATTTATNLFTVDVGSLNEAFFYEIITFGTDWGGFSAARVIKRGFHCPNGAYSHHTVVENAGTYPNGIIYSFTINGNVFNGRMRLNTGGVQLRCHVRLVGHISSYTIHGTQ